MIEINGLKKYYKNFNLDVDLRVEKGRVTGIVGSNGAGKTTLFKSILNLIKVDGGEIKVFGKDISDIANEDMENIGVVLSGSTFNENLTIKDTISILKGFYKKFDENLFVKLVDKNKLPQDKRIKELSTGMKAKYKLINALCHKPKLLILDEPTAGLDVIARNELVDLIRDFLGESEDNTVVISSHISKDLESLCDDFYLINDGKIVLHEDTDVLLSNYGLIKIGNDDEQIDDRYILSRIKTKLGQSALTNERQYYMENYPKMVVEKAGIDEIVMYLGGK